MTISYPSMLSYLQAGPGKIILRLSPSSSRISPFSFLDNEQDPLARLVQGAFVTDSGATIKEVNLLIQRDRIICSEEALPGLTNVEVEHYWRQGMKMRQDKAPEHTLHLGMQIDEQGALLPFSSLFYCRKRAVFFEPPCPVCGQGLLLCQDDALLRSEGLVPYTTGLRRYLFCPSCFEKKGPQVWYALKKELDDSETVHDAQALVQRFGRLDPGVAASRDIDILPCLRCQQRASCYGPQQEVHDHIFILAFYPFYMMLMERDNLDGFHFLRLSKNVRRSDQQGTGLPRTAQDDQAVGEEFSDRTVHTLLKNIARKWRQQGQQNSPAEQASSLAETVIQQGGLGGDLPSVAEGRPALDETLPLSNARTTIEASDDLHTETVLITRPADLAEQSIVQTSTVLLSDSAASAAPERRPDEQTSAEKRSAVQEDELAETILLRADKEK